MRAHGSGGWPTFWNGFEFPDGRSFVRRGGKGRRICFFSQMSLLTMELKRNRNPDPLKPERVGHPKKLKQSLGVDVLKWYHPTVGKMQKGGPPATRKTKPVTLRIRSQVVSSQREMPSRRKFVKGGPPAESFPIYERGRKNRKREWENSLFFISKRWVYSFVPAGYDARMDEDQFRRLLQLGHGRAILYARDHDVEGFRKLILDACLHCQAYDAQIEGTRASYMLDLLDLTTDKEFYYDEVLKALPGCGDDWDAAQRFHFAACLVVDGNKRAKRAMYESYNPGPKKGEAIAIEFLQMDGINGLLFATEKIGALLMATTEKVDLGWLMSAARETLGEQETQEALRKAGAENPRIEAYRLAEEERRNHLDDRLRKSGEMMSATYEQVKPKLAEMTSGWITSWGARANDSELDQAARGLAAARSPKDQYAHLRIFARRLFPLDIQLLLSLVDVEQERVGLAAISTLSQIAHPEVRQLAFRLVETRAKWRGGVVELLARNFRPGDHAIALRWFEAEEDPETLHSIGMDLTDLWERYPDEETEVPMLLAMYERGPCSFCREKTVRRLLERGALTEDLRLECSYDANGDVRDLAKGSPPKPPQG